MVTRLDRTFGVMGIAALAVVAALVALGLQTAAQLRDDVAELDRARDVQVRIQGVTATLLDLEANQRGYLLTLDRARLEPYRSGLAHLDRELGSLGSAAAHGDQGSEGLGLLRTLIGAKREELERGIALADTQGAAAALIAARDPRGQALTEDIRRALARLGAEWEATHAQQHAARAASIGRNERLVTLLAVALALLLLALLALVRRDRWLQARRRADEASAREQLERQVSDRTAELQSTAARLALSEERLRRIFESASEGILTTDASQVIVEANRACARMFGCEVSDLIGARLDRLIPARYREDHRRRVDAFGAGDASPRPMRNADGRREVIALRFDGEEFPIDASISGTEVDGRRLYTVIHRDLTEPRRAAAALRDSRQLIAATFDASSVAMVQIDPAARRFVAVNEAMCRLSAYPQAELLVMGPDDLNHPDDRLDASKLAALLSGSAGYREQKRLVRKDGGIVWVEITGSVVRDADGRALRLVGFLHDITARRKAEDALRGRERRQAFLVRLNDHLRELDDPEEIAYQAACLLGEFVQAERVGYAQDDGNGQTITVARHCTRGVPGIEGRYRYVDYGPQLLDALRAGRTVVRPDIGGDACLSESEKAAHAALQMGATVNVPVMRDAHLHAVFFVHSAAARAWSDDEVALFEDVALRIRADITRAVAQAAERAASATLAAAIDSMADAVCISDADGRIVGFNDAFVSFHRFRSPDECRRTLDEFPEILDVFTADGTPAPLDRWAVPRALRGEAASHVEYRLRRKDTGETWVGSYSFAPIRSDDGRITGSVVSGRDITPLLKTQQDLATSHAALQHLIANQQRVQEDERKRIARELHDDLQQSLAAIRMDTVAIGERLAKGRRDIEPLLARIDRLTGAAITSARRIVSDLRPEILEELGLRPALEALCAEHARRSGADCRFGFSGAEAAAHLDSPVLSIGLFRIAQEALNNVAKHARARSVRVHLDATEPGLVALRIADDGVGIATRDSRDPGSFGLLGMAERVRAMGGQLRIQGNGDHGTVISVRVPALEAGAADTPAGTAGGPRLDDGPDPVRGLGVWDVWGRPLLAVIDALEGHVAVLGPDGVIRFVNRGWQAFAARHGVRGLAGCGPGDNYLDVCRRRAADEPSAATVLQGLGAVLEGRNESFATAYACDTPDGRRWFRVHAASIPGGLSIVSHVEVNGPVEAAPADDVRKMPSR